MNFYFAGSMASEDLDKDVQKSDDMGVLFTFFDIPKKRWTSCNAIMAGPGEVTVERAVKKTKKKKKNKGRK